MRLYADFTGSEYVTFKERTWKGMRPIQRKARAEVKTGYRRRERLALKRLTDEMIIEELTQSAEELRFLWGKYEEWREFAKENSYSFSAETWR